MEVIVYFNEHPDHFLGYEHGHRLRRVFSYEPPTKSALFRLADEAFQAFNAPPGFVMPAYRHVAKTYRASGLRSLSVGDVLRVGDSWLVCAATSWIALVDEPSEVSDA